jgi:GPI-GlcNAc transferase complex, PIG-H component
MLDIETSEDCLTYTVRSKKVSFFSVKSINYPVIAAGFSFLYLRPTVWHILLVTILLVFTSYRESQKVTSESVTALKNIGIQLSITKLNQTTENTLILKDDIQSIVINEAVAGWRIKTYLMIIPSNPTEKSCWIPFENSNLSLPEIKTVYKGLREFLSYLLLRSQFSLQQKTALH